MSLAIIIKKHPTQTGKFLATISGGRLDGDLFKQYGAGTPFDPQHKGRIVLANRLQAYVAQLEAAGLKAALDEDALAKLKETPAREIAINTDSSRKLLFAEAALAKVGRKLYAYQVEGVKWLCSRQTALLADDMGMGKTVTALVAADSRILILCPSAAKGSWADEIAMARPGMAIHQAEGWDGFCWPNENEAVIMTYDILPPTQEEKDKMQELLASGNAKVLASITEEMQHRVLDFPVAGQAPEGVTVIADEAHAVKGGASTTARVARFRKVAYSAKAHGGRIFLLTATPLLNRPLELWNVFASGAMAYEAFGKFEEFAYNAGGSRGQYGWEWSPAEMNKGLIAEQMMKTTLRRMKKDYLLDLPSETHTWMNVKVRDLLDSGEVQELLNAEQLETLADTGLPDFEKTSAARAILAKAKIPAMIDVVESFEEQEEPLVVFSAHRSPIDVLATRKGWGVITGDTSAMERTRLIAAFQCGQLKGLGLTIQAGGVAITLTKACNALFVDSSWTPALDEQAEARIMRLGQKRACQYIHLQADSVLDRMIRSLHHKKSEFIQAVDMAATKPGEAVTLATPSPAPQSGQEAPAKAPENVVSLADHQAALDAAKKGATGDKKPLTDEERKLQRAKVRKAQRKADEQEYFTRTFKDSPELRQAQTPAEHAAISRLTSLANADADYAQEKNDIGFSKMTTSAGHRLVWRLELGFGLTDRDWADAVKISAYHRKQFLLLPPRKLLRQAG